MSKYWTVLLTISKEARKELSRLTSKEVKETEWLKLEPHEYIYILPLSGWYDACEGKGRLRWEVHRKRKLLGQHWKAKAVEANAEGVRAQEISVPLWAN